MPYHANQANLKAFFLILSPPTYAAAECPSPTSRYNTCSADTMGILNLSFVADSLEMLPLVVAPSRYYFFGGTRRCDARPPHALPRAHAATDPPTTPHARTPAQLPTR
jgi:hypothetical protein